ncbi:heterokaryon incompatibility protein-domain-containing protein [Dichomitus squalens]|uniref:Heterokaryon incompatibility protein-domain-containing protein n=1 Tax=Dichomitus squalens TaxID=114155 RepID=A0A4Q9MBI3_9APHY|nr:heterokaryon incompatibility protein-domain-containing protein [Dichomitus squalens]
MSCFGVYSGSEEVSPSSQNGHIAQDTRLTRIAYSRTTSAALARPRNLILNGRLIEVPQEPNREHIPYIAVSYTWDPDPELVKWEGRRVTTQALALATRLTRYTSYAIWIDAICIHQDDQKAKEEELPKMADIYRGAESVVSIISGVDDRTCEAVKRGVEIMETEAYRDLVDVGDIHGCFQFATGGGNPAFAAIFQHRWWERAWTFQEATLNPRTFLVGDAGDIVPMDDILKIVPAIRLKAASVSGPDGLTLTFGRPSSFWDSVSAMTAATTRALTLGEAIGCVWRRNASCHRTTGHSTSSSETSSKLPLQSETIRG